MLVECYTDSYSIYSYLSAQHLRFPAKKSTFYHLAVLREHLASGFLSVFGWTDTRDMVCDGMTKGRLPRDALQNFMRGFWRLMHAASEHREHSMRSDEAESLWKVLKSGEPSEARRNSSD